MKVSEGYALLKNNDAIVGIVYKNMRFLDDRMTMEQMISSGKLKKYNLGDKEVEFFTYGCAYGQTKETLIMRVRDDDEEAVTPPTEDDPELTV